MKDPLEDLEYEQQGMDELDDESDGERQKLFGNDSNV